MDGPALDTHRRIDLTVTFEADLLTPAQLWGLGEAMEILEATAPTDQKETTCTH